MFLAVVLVCATLEANSCTVMANLANIWYTEEECKTDSITMASTILLNGYYAKPKCFKVGDNA
tara:strand:+ start:149 stop:337 length:189 start_codon:yes stop_codon:yes gene_type:complete